MLNIPIVIAAYNRIQCFQRLLKSLDRAKYQQKVKLIISIDGGGSNEVVLFAETFQWKHGEKEVIKHKKNLGLKKHILSCGRLTKQYDGIILLEDDLYVSPFFYHYTLQTLSKYSNENAITGIALYSHQFNETAFLPFLPIEDIYDIYFLQLACSWGQSWLTHQWEEFDKWYQNNSSLPINKSQCLPPDIDYWPETSWKKWYIKFMIENNKFFVYPRHSHTTNFGDPGQHHTGTNVFQIPLTYGDIKLRLPDFTQSYAKYDAFCEILPKSLEHFQPELIGYDFSVDLYGTKNTRHIKTKYILTRQKTIKAIKSFGREIKPHELNIIDNINGNKFFLTDIKDFSGYNSFLNYRRAIYTNVKEIHEFYFSIHKAHYPTFLSKILDKTVYIDKLKVLLKNFFK